MKTYNLITPEKSIVVGGLVTVYYLRLPKNYVGMREKLPFCQLVYVDSGVMEYTVGEHTVTLGPGRVMITPPDIVRIGRIVSDGRGLVGIISFIGEGLGGLVMPSDGDADPIVFEPPQNVAAMLRETINEGVALLEPIYGDELYKGMRPKSSTTDKEISALIAKLTLVLCLLGLPKNAAAHHIAEDVSEVTPGKKPKPGDVHLFGRIKEYLERHVCSDVSVGDICREFNISSSQLKRLFRENEGCGVIDCFIGLKIERACILLSGGGMNITQISERLGFSSPHYFSRLFKQRTGIPPSEYAKNHKN